MSEKGSKGLREMTTGCALAGFLMPILVMIVLIVLGAEMTIASLAALFVMIGFCMFMGFKWERLDAAMAEGVRQVATAAMIMLLVGCMVAAWISSGTIPTLLYYGMKIITPKLFLPICFIVPAFMAICTGTSWGSISTIGVVLCGMAAGLGIPVGMAAGAVISGAFFGDKTSPLSDTTLLTASACEVPLFKHIASMWYTTLPGTLIFQGRGFMENLNYIMNGFSIESGMESLDGLLNRGGFSSMLSLVGIMLILGMLSGLFSESHVLTVLVNKLSKKLNTPGTILAGVWLSSLIICVIGGQYVAVTIPAVAFKDVCDEMDINRAVLSRTLGDVGVMVAALIPWNAWVIGYGVVLGGITVNEFIPYTFLPMLCPIISMIHNFAGVGLFHKDDEVKYRPLWRR